MGIDAVWPFGFICRANGILRREPGSTSVVLTVSLLSCLPGLRKAAKHLHFALLCVGAQLRMCWPCWRHWSLPAL